MPLRKKYHNSYVFLITGSISILVLQIIWLFHSYNMEFRHITASIKDAFELAYQKEQTYRIPVVDIVKPGEVTIQGCGNEEIMIIRKCIDADTVVYNNVSGHSIENFISRVFRNLREQITPMNIYCLSDLFAGMLYDRGIPVSFVIERYDIHNGTVLETTLFPDKERTEMKHDHMIVSEISDKEAIRAVLQLTPAVVLGNMTGILVSTFILAIITLYCIVLLFYRREKQSSGSAQSVKSSERLPDNIFQIGQYLFDPAKNELQGFGETIQLNKKENSILQALCNRHGDVVERDTLLEENWGSSGPIYSRSLDTYLASLRKYFKKDSSIQIVTVKGVGYRLICPK